MAAYLITLEYQRNSDGDLLDLEDVVFYQPVVYSFIIDLLAMAEWARLTIMNYRCVAGAERNRRSIRMIS